MWTREKVKNMAILNSVEGSAHVEIAKDGRNWKGYILVEPDPGNIRYFQTAGPAGKVIYEGPIFASGKYYLANGKALITETHYTPQEFRIDFRGIDALNMVKAFTSTPDDYLP